MKTTVIALVLIVLASCSKMSQAHSEDVHHVDDGTSQLVRLYGSSAPVDAWNKDSVASEEAVVDDEEYVPETMEEAILLSMTEEEKVEYGPTLEVMLDPELRKTACEIDLSSDVYTATYLDKLSPVAIKMGAPTSTEAVASLSLLRLRMEAALLSVDDLSPSQKVNIRSAMLARFEHDIITLEDILAEKE